MKRMVWMDHARGMGVILVVFGHMLGGVKRAGLFPDGALALWMDYTLYTFHMPLFFFLTGLNVQHSLRRGAGPFLASKGWTLAYPYVLWSLLQGGVLLLLAHDANNPVTPGDLAAIWHRPIGQFWFLYALMICHLLVVLVPGRAALAGLAAVGFVAFQFLPVRPDLSLTLHHLPFYVAGLYGVPLMAWRPRRGGVMLAGIGVVFAAAVAFAGLASGMDEQGWAALPACVLGISGVVLASKLLGPVRWLAAVGAMSMTIYVLHIMAGSGMRLALVKLHVPLGPWGYLLIVTAAGIVLPMMAHAVLARLHLLTALGLAPLSMWRGGRSEQGRGQVQ